MAAEVDDRQAWERWVGAGSMPLGAGLVVAIPALVFFFAVDIVCSIKAAIAASKGEQYELPLAVDFLK